MRFAVGDLVTPECDGYAFKTGDIGVIKEVYKIKLYISEEDGFFRENDATMVNVRFFNGDIVQIHESILKEVTDEQRKAT
jgi:hypothetical protein